MKTIIAFPFYVIGITLFVIAAAIVVIGYFNLRIANLIGD